MEDIGQRTGQRARNDGCGTGGDPHPSPPPLISVVSPVYGCPEAIPQLCLRLHQTLRGICDHYEIILVEDCSPDDSWSRIREEARRDRRVRGIRFSRNFGQHVAITAGLEKAAGDWQAVIDCDLQDRPEEIAALYRVAISGSHDVVQARRVFRKDSLAKRLSSKLFHSAFGYLTGTTSDPAIGNFGIYSRRAIDGYLSMGDQFRCFPIMLQWVGYPRTTVEVEHDNRASGRSSYTWLKLFDLAFSAALSYSHKPLYLTVRLGLGVCGISILFALYTLLSFFIGVIKVPGYASLILSIWFLSGTMIFILGMVGLYVAKVFDKVKERPLYIIAEQTDVSADDPDLQPE